MALAVMRRHRRWLFVFLWLVIAAFIILYIPAFQGADVGSPGEAMAKVGGLPITVGEFRRSYLRQRQRLEQLYQGRLDADALRSMGIEEQVFSALVDDRLVALEVKRLGLSIDDETVAREVAHRFQENGRYIGSDEIRRRLELQGGTVEEFEQSLREGLLRERLERLVTDGVAVSPAEAEREFRRRTEQVKAEYVLVDAAPFRAAAASVSDDEVARRFESDREAYRIPEQRAVQYLVVDEASLANRVAVTDGELQSYYQEHRDEFKEPEEVCASHILVKVKATPEAAEGRPDAEARKMAEALLAQVKAGGDFAAIARKSSEDKGSATGGGDLGCFGRGHMLPAFENAAFSLAPGEVSELVKTDFGYHVIQLKSRKEETVPALSQVKDRIRQTLLSQRARALVEEKMIAVSDALRRGRGLEEAGREQGLAAKKSAAFARGEIAPSPLSSSVLVARVFELKSGQVEPEPFSVPGGYVFVGLAEVRAPRVPDLKEAQARVKTELVEEKALQAARSKAAELRARAEKEGLEKAASALGLVRKETAGLVGRGQPLGDMGTGAALEDAAFSLSQGSLSDPVRTVSGYAVLRVLEKKAFDPAAFEGQKATIVASLKDQRRQQLFRAYLAQARQRYTVERRPEAFQRVLG
jgi:peptidyl-prolyl cis-trans isomerase D